MEKLRGLFTRRNAMLLASLVCGFGALLVGDRFMTKHLDELAKKRFPEQQFVAVLVADRDLREGDSVGSETVSVMKLPAKWMHEDLLLADAFSEVINRKVNRKILRGTPIGGRDLEDLSQQTLVSQIPAGYRLVSVKGVADVDQLVASHPRVNVDVWEQTMHSEIPSSSADFGGFSVLERGSPRIQQTQARLLMSNVSILRERHREGVSDQASKDSVFIAIPADRVAQFVSAKTRGALTFSVVATADQSSRPAVSRHGLSERRAREVEVIVHSSQGASS